MITVYVLAWIGAAFFVTFMSRDRRRMSISLGVLAMWPLGAVLSGSYYGTSSPVSVSEAPLGVLFISVVVGGGIALLASLGLNYLWALDRRSWIAAGLFGLAGGLLAFPIFASFRAPHGWERSFDGFGVTVLIQIALCTAVSGIGLTGLRRPPMVTAGISAAIATSAALYFLPDIAFRLHHLGTPLNPLEERGARRALGRPDSATEGQRALTLSGDPTETANFKDRVRRDDIAGLENDLVVLAARSQGDADFRDALLAGLRIAISRYRDEDSFDESDRAVEAYCQAYSRVPDRRAVPDLIRAYGLTKTNMNIRESAAEALGKAVFPEAEAFVIAELGRLHPVGDRGLAVKLAGEHKGVVLEAYEKLNEAGVEQKSRMRERDEPVRALIARGDMDAIVRRAMSNDSGADQATIELIKRKHPKRFEAVAKNATLRVRGADFTTFRDPELYRYLANRDLLAIGNSHITRFLCEWAPLESCALLGRLLKTPFASSAVVGLSHCRHSDAPKILLRRLQNATPGDGVLTFMLIRALGLRAYDPAASLLGRYASGAKTAGSFNANGASMDAGEIARWGLSRMSSPEAKALSAKYPVRDTSWLQKWDWR